MLKIIKLSFYIKKSYKKCNIDNKVKYTTFQFSTTMNIRNFVNKNIVVIVMVPMLAGAHYGWMKLQEVDSLVSEKERKNVPIYSWFNK